MSESVDFSLSKDRMIWLILCSGVVLLLLFGAGVAAGFLLAGSTPGERETRESREPVKKEIGKAKMPGMPAVTIAKASAPKSSKAISGEGAGTPPTGAQEHLSIEAASFPQESQASHLAALLQRDGYHPVSTGPDSASSEISYYVRLGPYQSWEQASRIATELNRSYALHSVVKPIRPIAVHS